MANENKDIKRIHATAANIISGAQPTIEKQTVFANDTKRLIVHEVGGAFTQFPNATETILASGANAFTGDQSHGGYGITGIRDAAFLDTDTLEIDHTTGVWKINSSVDLQFVAPDEFVWESSDAPEADFRLSKSDFDQWKLYSDESDVRLLLTFSDFELEDADYLTGSTLRLFKRDPDSWVMATEGNTATIFESAFFTFTDPQKNSSAAKVADDYENNGYSDWFLMSKDEAAQLYANRAYIDDYSTNEVYWTSSEVSATNAWLLWDNGTIISKPKSDYGYVRPIRTGTQNPMTYNLGDGGPGGGKIFYISGTTYLEAAPTDAATPPGSRVRYTWASATDWSSLVGGTNTAIGTGDENTALIVAAISVGNGVTFDSLTGTIFNSGKSSVWDFHVHGASVDDIIFVDTSADTVKFTAKSITFDDSDFANDLTMSQSDASNWNIETPTTVKLNLIGDDIVFKDTDQAALLTFANNSNTEWSFTTTIEQKFVATSFVFDDSAWANDLTINQTSSDAWTISSVSTATMSMTFGSITFKDLIYTTGDLVFDKTDADTWQLSTESGYLSFKGPDIYIGTKGAANSWKISTTSTTIDFALWTGAAYVSQGHFP